MLFDVIKWPLIGISLLAVAWYLHWQFGNDDADEEQEGYPWIEIPLIIVSVGLFIAFSIWLTHLPAHMQGPIAQTVGHVLELILTVAKWPLIFMSILGVEYAYWWVFIDDSDSSWKNSDDPFIIFFTTWARRNRIVFGIELMFVIFCAFCVGVFYQLPLSIQQSIQQALGHSFLPAL